MQGAKTGGRKAGSVNKTTAMAKDNILAVFNRLGGTAGMAEWAKENKTEFYKLYGKLIPAEMKLTGDPDNPVTFSEVTRTIVKPK